MKIEKLEITVDVDDDPDTSYLGELTDKLEPGVMSTRTWEFLKWHFGEPVDVPPQNHRGYRFFKPYAGGEKVGTKLYYKYAQQDARSMCSFMDGQWCFLGIGAKATVSYQIACGDPQPNRRTETLESGGVGCVESDATEYVQEIAQEQLDELREHLEQFGIHPTDEDWKELAEQAIENANI